MADHAIFSPSRLSRIIQCPGSVNLTQYLDDLSDGRPIEPSVYAQHGTMLHTIMDQAFINKDEAIKDLDLDDKNLIEDCLNYLAALKKSHKAYYMRAEEQVNLKQWGLPEVWGTLDYSLFDYVKQHMDIIDWKFGAGVIVYAKENSQMLAYAAGSIGWPTQIKTITLHIVQPAIDNYSTWDCSIDYLYNWVHGTLAKAINESLISNMKFNPGIEQCRWCEAKVFCPPYINRSITVAMKLFETKEQMADNPSIEDLISIINDAPFIENAIKEIRLYLQKELELGRSVPGLKLIEGRSNRKWIDESQTVLWLSKYTDIEDVFSSKLKSPSQIEKEDRKLKKNDVFKTMYEKPKGKVSLVPESDNRPALQPESKAIDVFSEQIE